MIRMKSKRSLQLIQNWWNVGNEARIRKEIDKIEDKYILFTHMPHAKVILAVVGI